MGSPLLGFTADNWLWLQGSRRRENQENRKSQVSLKLFFEHLSIPVGQWQRRCGGSWCSSAGWPPAQSLRQWWGQEGLWWWRGWRGCALAPTSVSPSPLAQLCKAETSKTPWRQSDSSSVVSLAARPWFVAHPLCPGRLWKVAATLPSMSMATSMSMWTRGQILTSEGSTQGPGTFRRRTQHCGQRSSDQSDILVKMR